MTKHPRRRKRKRPPGADFFKEFERVTRKEYKCGDCRGWISPGDRARYVVGVTNGEFWHRYGCYICT